MPPDYVSPYLPFMDLFVKILICSLGLAFLTFFALLMEIPVVKEWVALPIIFLVLVPLLCFTASSVGDKLADDKQAHKPQLLSKQVHAFTVTKMTTGVEQYAELRSVDGRYTIPFMYLGRTCLPLNTETRYNFALETKKYWNGAIVASYDPEYVRRTVCGR